MDASSSDLVVVPSFVMPDFSRIGIPSFDPTGIVSILFAVIFAWWAIFTIIAVYHWLRFGRSSWFALPSIVLHLFVSYKVLVYMTSGLH